MTGYGHAGSALVLSPELALTCDHVIRPHPDPRPLAPQQVFLGVDRHRVTRIIPSPPGFDDLALLHLKHPIHCAPPVFSRQWLLDDLYAYGYRYAPFTHVERDGPVTLDRRSVSGSVPRQVRATPGLPKGFSGGPLTGTFQGSRYCVGINWRGGDGAATSVFIPAAACQAFVHAHVPGVCRLEDLGPQALVAFLRREEELLREKNRKGEGKPALVVSRRSFRRHNGPVTTLAQINHPAFEHLARGTLPPRIAIPLNARELADFLTGAPGMPPKETICRFLGSRRAPLQMTDTLEACLDADLCVFVIEGYVGSSPGTLDKFLSRLGDR
jgi:hypothetical protein